MYLSNFDLQFEIENNTIFYRIFNKYGLMGSGVVIKAPRRDYQIHTIYIDSYSNYRMIEEIIDKKLATNGVETIGQLYQAINDYVDFNEYGMLVQERIFAKPRKRK